MPSDVAQLLSKLVQCESISGNEEKALQTLARWLEERRIDSKRIGRNLIATIGSGEPVLWLNSHLDTVRAADGYTFSPWSGEITKDGRILGLGANDAKGSIAAMAETLVQFEKTMLFTGTLCLVAVCDEETGGQGMDWLRTKVDKPDAVIVGEPNMLQVANQCKGLVRAWVEAAGVSAHASRPWQGVNAVRVASPAIEALCADHGLPVDPVLGKATHEITKIEGGKQLNALPAHVIFQLDCRTTPTFNNAAMVKHLKELIEPLDGCSLHIKSERLKSTRTALEGRLVQAALQAREQEQPVAFDGVCDFVHVGDCDAVIMGPGEPSRSHKIDEYLTVDELESGVAAYMATARRYFAT